MSETATLAYTVALCDFPELPQRERTAAEARYARVLERQLGGPEGVAGSLAAVQCLQDGDEAPEGTDPMATINRWARAAAAARTAGMQGLGESEGAYFEVRMA
ncbi:hypothetical protein C8241_08740 [Paracidovorax avenae]|uniref:hypothetical protein n=1 Tax=Paracidovorax avenae TaxID=80867 RepID=UPI000D16E1CD|nr:hypothetical protein [Paracidovorax avenae]AVS61777.1 hypothetical protein C8241_08740 [Paracidovorax avenae]